VADLDQAHHHVLPRKAIALGLAKP